MNNANNFDSFFIQTSEYSATSGARSIDNAVSVVDMFKLSPVPVGTGLISYAGDSAHSPSVKRNP